MSLIPKASMIPSWRKLNIAEQSFASFYYRCQAQERPYRKGAGHVGAGEREIHEPGGRPDGVKAKQ